MDISTKDIVEYTGIGAGLSFSTFKEASEYFLFDFPITQINEYIYTLVLLATLTLTVKRFVTWLFKSNKAKSNDND